MEKWIAGLLADAFPPEKPKFKSPLVLVHGLWSSSWCWRPWATHFSNLGWECWALNWRGRVGERHAEVLRRLSFQDCLEDLKNLFRASPFPPVVMAHGMGGLMALKAAEETELTALILLSSLPPRQIRTALPRSLRLFRMKYLALLFFGRPFVPEKRDFFKTWLASVPEGSRRDILEHMVPESTRLVRELFSPRVDVDPRLIRCPLLVVGGSEDRVVPPASLGELAERFGADRLEYPGRGHWMMGEGGGEGVVRDIHRWVVRELGEGLLLADLSGPRGSS